MRKTVDVDTNKVIQVKYIGDENWGNLKEKIENGPKKVKTFMVYLNVGERYGYYHGLYHRSCCRQPK